MPSISPGNIVEVTTFGSYDQQAILNVFHYRYVGVTTISDADYATNLTSLGTDFKDKVWNPVANSWRSRVVDLFSIQRIRVQLVYPTRGYYQDVPVNQGGISEEPGVPPDFALTMSFRTDRAFRGATGSKRFTGCISSQYTLGSWKDDYLALWALSAPNFLLTLQGNDITRLFRPTIWSPKRPGDNVTILGTLVQRTVRTQHRRQVGLGI